MLGRVVEIKWTDPNTDRSAITSLKKGRVALATWTEYGIVYDITDGIVLIVHSMAASPGVEETDEVVRTAVPESLIESLVVFSPEGGPAVAEP